MIKGDSNRQMHMDVFILGVKKEIDQITMQKRMVVVVMVDQIADYDDYVDVYS